MTRAGLFFIDFFIAVFMTFVAWAARGRNTLANEQSHVKDRSPDERLMVCAVLSLGLGVRIWSTEFPNSIPISQFWYAQKAAGGPTTRDAVFHRAGDAPTSWRPPCFSSEGRGGRASRGVRLQNSRGYKQGFVVEAVAHY